jgi:indole-3-glycerol phosphate synthase
MGKDFLEIIVNHKKEEIIEAKKLVPESQLRREAVISVNRRPFLKKLENPGPSGVNIIAEIKRASPSKGNIRLDLNPATYAQEYEKGGASAISVLTDQAHFKGSIDDLKKARESSTIPVLRKDFLISSYQIYESSVIGVDAVLLIARILSREQLRSYLSLCNELKLDALVEIYSEKDLEAATWAKARLIGINNRNLSSFETNIDNAIKLVSLLETYQIPVVASGIQNRGDVVKNQQAGIWNFLIGESLVRAENRQAFLKSLMG